MRDLGVVCGCRFCRCYRDAAVDASWHPCGCPLGTVCRHVGGRLVVEGVEYSPDRVVYTGGRAGRYILLDQGEEYVWLSARRAGSTLEGLGIQGVEVARFRASVHGCTKILKHQEVVIYRPPASHPSAGGQT